MARAINGSCCRCYCLSVAAAALASLQNAEFAYKVKLKMPVGMAKKTPKTQALKRAPKKPNECSSLSLSTRRRRRSACRNATQSTSSWRWLWKPFDAALSRSERRSQNIYIDLQLSCCRCQCCFYSWNSSINCRHFIFDGHRAEMRVTYSPSSPSRTQTQKPTGRKSKRTTKRHGAASLYGSPTNKRTAKEFDGQIVHCRKLVVFSTIDFL